MLSRKVLLTSLAWMLVVVTQSSAAWATGAILINFTSDRCPPCQAMKPVLAGLERVGVPVRHVNVESELAVASRYGIRKTPTFVVISGGKEVTRLVGMQTAQQLQEALQTDPSGPIYQTNSEMSGLADIPAPKTRLAPISQPQNLRPTFQDRGSNSSSHQFTSAANTPSSNASAADSSAQGNVSEPMPSVSLASAIERAEAATVRLRVHDGRGYGAGTGTIIDTHGDEALVLTCGHLFRETKGDGKIEVDLFIGGQTRTVEGHVLDYDADDRDIALVTIRPGFPVQPIPVIQAGEVPRTGQSVFSFGCDRGDDPSRRDTRITGVNKYNQHLGSSNIEIGDAPIDGRSGGGLFDDRGFLIGVCNAADYQNDVGIYAGPGNIQWQLDRVGLAKLYQRGGTATQEIAQVSQQFDSPSLSMEPPAERLAALPGARTTMPTETSDQEVIVIVRDRRNPAATSRVMTLQQPTDDLMNMIEQHAR
ncbi:trypsin-like peptidase domain-containing protein [Rubripirellula amarantea]|nr:trypsin-like peptidase domain-containing protein [Rubripirellula amarantea]